MGMNYKEQGGDKTVIGGTLEFKDGARIINRPQGMGGGIAPATSAKAGGVKKGFNVTIDENGVLSMDYAWGVNPGRGISWFSHFGSEGYEAAPIARLQPIEVADIESLRNIETLTGTFNSLISALINSHMMSTESGSWI